MNIVRSQILAVTMTLVMAGAAAAKENFSANHLARLRTVMAIEISPNGQQIAYVLNVPRRPFVEENGPAWTELHVVDQAGSSRAYVSAPSDVAAIAWKPDGSGISFLAKRGSDKQRSLYFIPLAGGEARKILEHEADIADYSWSPDGKSVAFTARDKEKADEKELKEKGFDQQVYEEKLEPSRVWVAQLRTPDVWDESDPAKPQRFELPGHASGVQWSPAGQQLAVSVAPTPLIDDEYMKRKVHVISASDGAAVGVIDNPGKLGAFRWSPDGAYLALIAGADIHDPNPGRLMVAPKTGGKPVDVLPGLKDADVTDLGWRDKDTIVFLTDRGVTSGLATVPRQGQEPTFLIPHGKYSFGALSVADDGQRMALLSDSPQRPAEVFAFKPGDNEPKRLTNNNPWLDGVNLAKQEIVTHAARDGLELQGLLIRPLNEKPGEKYPLVMVVHGGPEAHNRHGWLTAYSQPGQLLAAEGFAVFYPNYRGSTGRGVEFSMKGQADYAGKEFDDLIDAVDHLVGTGLVNKSKVGVTGGSYGGFASAWCATKHTDRFAASVMFVGISDLVSKLGTTDIPNEMLLVHSRKHPWDDWDFFTERSPIRYVPQAKTPILIMHGKDDPRVHPSQSLELYRYLKTYGKVPVRLVFYQGEGHGNRKAAARQDYALRLVGWMKHYLQGPGGNPPPPDVDYSGVKPKETKADAKADAKSDKSPAANK
jgi:dipeptidyl aminopeptidase/acylaminoacyl peptidase